MTLSTHRRPLPVLVLATLLALAGGCSKIYYGTMEAFGYEKRELLVRRVQSAREAQEQARRQLVDTHEQFGSIVRLPAGDGAAQYDRLGDEYEDLKDAHADARAAIAEMDNLADDLFREWRKELKRYSDRELRKRSERELAETRGRYQGLEVAMRRAEEGMGPLLRVLEDQVLFLKHRPDAGAAAALQEQAETIGSQVRQLTADIDAAIAQADAFIVSIRRTA